MSESYEHNPGDHDDPLGGPTWLVGIVGTIILIVIVLAVTAVMKFTATSTEDVQMVAPSVEQLNQIRQRDAQRLNSEPRLVEYINETGNVATRMTVPIDHAIQRTAQQFGGSGPRASASSPQADS